MNHLEEMQMKKILVIEDEESIRGFIRVNFQAHHFTVLEAVSGEAGLEKANEEQPEVVLLDVMLPGIDGFQVCEQLRKQFPGIGIIMLTAKGQDVDRIKGLKFGADDYIVKPFNPLELVLRVKALMRRMKKTEEAEAKDTISRGPFFIDLNAKKCFKNDVELALTPKEFQLLKLFMENPGKAFSRNDLLDLVWGLNFVGDTKIVDVNIRRLRTKIEDTPSNSVYIETIWGTGYCWKKE